MPKWDAARQGVVPPVWPRLGALPERRRKGKEGWGAGPDGVTGAATPGPQLAAGRQYLFNIYSAGTLTSSRLRDPRFSPSNPQS